MNLTFVWIKNGVFGGKTCRGFRVIGVNFHICWKRACVKDLTNIMSATDTNRHAKCIFFFNSVNFVKKAQTIPARAGPNLLFEVFKFVKM